MTKHWNRWGKAIYFAENASYSHAYRYTTKDGYYQMFLARVTIGDFIEMSSDTTLTKPPQKSLTNSEFKSESYDSVKGHTQGSDVYMIYMNQQTYPFYLITYTVVWLKIYQSMDQMDYINKWTTIRILIRIFG